jgi:hypothetical protein
VKLAQKESNLDKPKLLTYVVTDENVQVLSQREYIIKYLMTEEQRKKIKKEIEDAE